VRRHLQHATRSRAATGLRPAFAWKRGGALAGVLSTLLAGAAHAGTSGQVLDEVTNQPIAGAVVVVEWQAMHTNFVEADRECLHVETAVTDAKGRYRVASWAGAFAPRNLIYYGRYHRYAAYKFNYVPGFRRGDAEGVLRLKPFTGTPDEWFAPTDSSYPVGELSWFGFRMHYEAYCFDRESQHNLFRLYDTFAKDAALIARSPQQKRYVAVVNNFAQALLVNWSKPTHIDRHGDWVNDDPADAYTPEMLLK